MAAFSPKLPSSTFWGAPIPTNQSFQIKTLFRWTKKIFCFRFTHARSFPKNIAISYACNQKSPLRKKHEIINLYPLVGSPLSSSSFPLKTLLPLFIPLCLHPPSLDPVTLFYPTVKVARRRFPEKPTFFGRSRKKKRRGEGN